jgi:hypothetical protein
MPTCAACAESRVPAPSPPSAPATTRRYSPATSPHSSRALQARCLPSPCTGLSPARTTTKAPPPPAAISGRCALPAPQGLGEGERVPTFTAVRSAGWRPAMPRRACRDDHAATRRGPTAAEYMPPRAGLPGIHGETAHRMAGPYPPGLSRRPHLRGFCHWITCVTPFRLACRARAVR